MPLLERNRNQDNAEPSAQPSGVELPPAICADLLDPALWQDGLAKYARGTNLAVALADVAGRLIGSTINPRPTWSLLHAKTLPLSPPLEESAGGVGCPFSLAPLSPCNCVADALARGGIVVARDRTGLVHFAVPLVLGVHPLGALVAGQVFTRYPEQLPVEHIARKLLLSPGKVWELARLEHPVKQATLEVYADLLATLGQTFLQTRYHSLREAELLAEMTRLRDQAVAENVERKRAEQALRESEQRVRFVMDSMPQKVFTATPNGDLDYFNPQWTEFTGLSFEQIRDWGWTQFIHPDDVAENVRVWRHSIDTDEPFQIEHRFRGADGEYRWHIGRALPMRDEAGRVLMWVGSNTDVQDIKQAEAALHVSEVRYRRLFESAKDGTLILDAANGTILDANPFMSDLLGYSQGDFLGKELWEIGLFSDKSASEAAVRELQEKGYLRYDTLLLESHHGRQVEVEIVANVHREIHRSVIQCNIRDITERKLFEAQLKNVNANLQQKNRELDEFVRMVSHDLKSPLVTIGGMLGLLKEELQEERLVAAGELIATAEETVVGMRDTIDDLLKLSRIGTLAIDLQPVGLRQVAEELVRKHAPQLEDKHTAVSLELSEDQPTVLADLNRLVEVLDNLIENALKYACDGPEPRITIGSETVGREVRMFVQDNGPGIGKQDHEKIFGLFQRLDESKEGSGVGLAIVKRIMEVHGGRVWVESAVGEGATFWLAFPAAVGEASMSFSAQGRTGRA
jgi:PAS domain S-box-containing protein